MKLYRLTQHFRLETTVDLNGVHIPVSFSGGYNVPTPTNGSLATDDEELQKALEADPSFNVLWVLVHDDEQVEETEEDQVDPTAISGITNFTLAKEYIRENYPDIRYEEIMSKEKLLAVAESLNLTFPDWIA